MDSLPELLNSLVTVSNAISSIASVLGFITLLATIIGYFLARRDCGFGSKYDKSARHYKFFRPIADALPTLDKNLEPLQADASGPFATYRSSRHLRYRAHFVPEGRFGVYLLLNTPDAKAVSDSLRHHEGRIRTHLGLDKRPGLLGKLFRSDKRLGNLQWESVKQRAGKSAYRVTLYYPDDVRITSSGRKLKRVRRWALNQLVKFQQVFDQQVPQVREELKQVQASAAAVEATAIRVTAAS